MKHNVTGFSIILLLLVGTAAMGQEPRADQLQQYQPQQQVSGTIRIWGHGAWGHDYIKSLVLEWEKGFQKYQPNVQFETKLMGTASAIGSLYTGTGDLALMGREVWPIEITAFRQVMKYDPTSVEVTTGSFDVRNKNYTLAFFVHKDNPLSQISLEQVKRIFGCDGDCGQCTPKHIRKWGDLGLTGEWANKPVHIYGFEIHRGFGVYLEQMAFNGSEKWNPELKEFGDLKKPDGSLLDAGKRVTNALANDPYGIAFSSMLYRNPEVKALALAVTNGGPYVPPTKETVFNRSYPLVRVTTMVFDRKPGKPVDPKVKEFLRYILSREGQQAVDRSGGYLSLSEPVVLEQLRVLE